MKELSRSERELAGWLQDGMPTPGIAAKMGQPVEEVERRVRNLYAKLGVSNRAELNTAYCRLAATPEVMAALKTAQARLVEQFRGDGVTRVDLLHDYMLPVLADVWLITQTDEERDRLRALPDLPSRVRAGLRAAGVQAGDIRVAEIVVQSQETVDRDSKGDWFYATR